MADTALKYLCDTYGNEVLYDADGKPSIFVRHPKMKSSEFDPILPNHTHPAFIVGNTEDDTVLIGKYMSSELTANGTQYSLPNMPPRVTITHDAALEKMRAFGGRVSGLTIADHGLLVLLAHKLGISASHGNNNYSADYRAGTHYTLNAAVTAGTKRIFRGWEYECLVDHTTSANLLPVNSPGYWEKGKQVGGVPVPTQFKSGNDYSGYNTLTGSGPIDWYFHDDPAMEADIQGNAAEQVYGFRLVNCEIQILPNNNAADPSANVSASSSDWRAILPHDSDDGYDLVAPGTAGTVHYAWLNSKLTLVARALDDAEFDNISRSTAYKNIAVDSTTLPYVPSILYELGLCPLPSTTVDGMIYVMFTKDERVARRGGYYAGAPGAGVAGLRCYHARAIADVDYGSRPRSRPNP